MATLLEYFKNDFLQSVGIESQLDVKTGNGQGASIDAMVSLRCYFDAACKVLTFYIKDSDMTYRLCGHLIESWQNQIEQIGVDALSKLPGDVTAGVEFPQVNSSRLYLYTETQLDANQIKVLGEVAVAAGAHVTFRSMDYVATRSAIEKPLAFICHDSRDKEHIAQPIAMGLSSRLCPVWYDEYSLKVGDSLRESIEKGIKEAKKCIVVLTPNFITNTGWTKTEFNSVFTRERIFNERIVLPIWHGLNKNEVYEYSPSLADTFALSWPKQNSDQALYDKAVALVISKLHTAITG